MKSLALFGGVLVILGLAGFALGHFPYSSDKTVIVLGPVHATVADEHMVIVPDIAAAAAVLAGVVLLGLGARRTA